MAKMQNRVYFPNLDAIRFFCFLTVFFFHSFSTPYSYLIESSLYQLVKSRLFGNGNLGVNFFFVLSGFLITYLLLTEKETFRKIDIKKFYWRRVLKIWPLFYFCVFFGFVVFRFLKSSLGGVPNEQANPLYYLFFLNNLDLIRTNTDSSVLTILWSVAIEEQFYLVWPLVIGFCRKQALPFVFAFILLGSFLFRLSNYQSHEVVEKHTLSCISDLCVGGIGAYLSFYSTRFLNLIKNLRREMIGVIYALCLLVFLFRKEVFSENAFLIAFDRVFISLLFLLVILEQNFSVNSLFKMQSLKIASRLGKYTYGLYCLHMIGILIVATLLAKLNFNTQLWQVLFLEGGLSLIVTIGIAYISYHLYEKRFLQLKNRFAVVNTSPPEEVNAAGKEPKEQKLISEMNPIQPKV